jgi:hypothetical protein
VESPIAGPNGLSNNAEIQVRNLNDNIVVKDSRISVSHGKLAENWGIAGKPGNYGILIERNADGKPIGAVIGSDAFPNLTDAEWEIARARLAADTGLRPELIIRRPSLRGRQ